MNSSGQDKIYQAITDRILELLGNGVVPWRKPWKGEAGLPRNLVSGKSYRGVNVFLLACWGGSPWWLTFRQAETLGGHVRRGAKGLPVIFWKQVQIEDPDDKDEAGKPRRKTVPMLRQYTVFNLEQCEGIKAPAAAPEVDNHFEPIEAAAQIIAGMPDAPEIRHGGNRAFYRHADDVISVPKPEAFAVPAEYFCTVYHELTHSTGAAKRLARKSLTESDGFGGHEYSKEELVAEFGAAFLCAHAGIEAATIVNSAAYIGGWLKSLKSNPKWAIQAAGQAQKAADYVLNVRQALREAA